MKTYQTLQVSPKTWKTYEYVDGVRTRVMSAGHRHASDANREATRKLKAERMAKA